ncbi:cytidine deaminase [Aspergillus flavus]|uniref:Cytidine deaminase n=1 Tax=Aspergillus flavus TaxID=5059 RepID=A0AB74CCG5_ASPFL|nr:cytidine deaminase [Aspergillus flavus]
MGRTSCKPNDIILIAELLSTAELIPLPSPLNNSTYTSDLSLIPTEINEILQALLNMSSSKPSLTTQELQTLASKAIAAKATAYCPYSKFRVGACILTQSGEYIVGANVENASYPVGTCAERVAFGTAVVAGYHDFKAVAVATDSNPPASPCGMCRQFMNEFTTPSFPIYMYGSEGTYTIKTMREVRDRFC